MYVKQFLIFKYNGDMSSNNVMSEYYFCDILLYFYV